MLQTLPDTFHEIGARLRAHRIGRGYSPEALAARLGISRAALYRVEKGEISKIGLLGAISDELGVSLPSLLGVGIEYIDNALSFFERMRQLEDSADQIVGVFSPVSYLLTSPRYDAVLREVLIEGARLGPDAQARVRKAEALLPILQQRKENFLRRRPLIASIISSVELERFLRHGIEGRPDLPEATLAARRAMALEEVRHIAGLLREQAIGVQIGVAQEPIPATSFQITRSRDQARLTISPFRLGQQPNIEIGVGLVTAAPEAIALHDDIARRLWETSLKSTEAADLIDGLVETYSARAQPEGVTPPEKGAADRLRNEILP